MQISHLVANIEHWISIENNDTTILLKYEHFIS